MADREIIIVGDVNCQFENEFGKRIVRATTHNVSCLSKMSVLSTVYFLCSEHRDILFWSCDSSCGSPPVCSETIVKWEVVSDTTDNTSDYFAMSTRSWGLLPKEYWNKHQRLSGIKLIKIVELHIRQYWNGVSKYWSLVILNSWWIHSMLSWWR